MNRDRTLFLAFIAGIATLAGVLYVFELKLFEPLSPFFLSHPPFGALFNEYTPLAITIIILVWIKMERLKQEDSLNLEIVALIVGSVVLFFLIFYRVWDMAAMLINVPEIHMRIWMRIIFYGMLSPIFMGFFTIFYGWKGFKTMFTTMIIPAFYTFNSDVVLKVGVIPSFSIFAPIYQFIIEYGRFETLVVSSVLNLFNIQNVVDVSVMPYRLMCRGTMYLVDVPCIGWEGVVGYAIIFLIFMSEFVKDNKMRVVWAILGFLGTLLVNLIRLLIIFFAGVNWGASVADLVHQNVGDVIFLVWIFGFIYVILWFSKRQASPPISQ